MVVRLLASTILALGLMQGAAFAQSGTSKSGTTSGSSTNAQMNQNTQTLPEEMEQKLKNQGFTDVEVVPGSFIVSAKDKDGDPVSMVIGPNSMTIFTMITPDNQSTTGSASSGTGDSKSSSQSKN